MTLIPFIILPMRYEPTLSAPAIPVLIIGFSLLLVYSICIELMIFAPKDGRSYQRGTYGFSRHPGWLWYTAMHILLGIRYGYPEAASLMLLCILLNLVVIILEDRWIFPKLFCDYDEYKQRVRFLL